jgi:hypothetical protein
VISRFVTGTVRVSHNDLHIRYIEWEIVISSVPQDHIYFLLGLILLKFIRTYVHPAQSPPAATASA